MAAELLFLGVALTGILAFNKQFVALKNEYSNPLYLCWILMTISVFDYYPSIVQYAFRAGAILISALYIVQKTGKVRIVRCPIVVLLILYLIYCMWSTLYSVDKVQTFIKVVELLIDIFLIMGILQSEETMGIAIGKMIKLTFILLVLIEIYVFVGMFALPSVLIKHTKGVFGIQLTGGILSSNSIGAASLFIIIYLLNKKNQKFGLPIMGLALLELVLSQARTSFASLVLILVVFFFRTKRKFIYFFAVILGAIVAYFNWDLIIAFLVRGADQGNLTTMSGRTTMWAEAMELIVQRPLFGYGFGSGGEMISKLHNNMSSLHSGIYETLIGVGYIGFGILLFIYIIGSILLLRMVLIYGIRRSSFEIMFWIDISIRTYMSTGVGGWHSYGIMIWYLLLFSLTFCRWNGTVADNINAITYIDDGGIE